MTILSDPTGMVQPLANIPPAMIHPIGLIDAIGLMQPLMATRHAARPIAFATSSDAMHPTRPTRHLSMTCRRKH